MTTLPQTTARLARPPSALPQVSSNGNGAPFGFMAHSPASGPQMTANDAWRVLRANAWLIAAFFVTSVIAGYVMNLWLAKYYPKYTAMAIVAVSPPIQLDPLKVGEAPLDPTILAMEQQNNAQLLKNLQLYSEVLQRRPGRAEPDGLSDRGSVAGHEPDSRGVLHDRSAGRHQDHRGGGEPADRRRERAERAGPAAAQRPPDGDASGIFAAAYGHR
jgi:hypothetical protein